MISETGKTAQTPKSSRVSDKSVMNATGKDWNSWFRILERNKMHMKPHSEIAAWISSKYKLPSWWCQNVTVEFEKAKGLREDYQKQKHFEISVSRTIAKPPEEIFAYFAEPLMRRKWLRHKLDITTATVPKSLRALWIEDSTRISVNIYPKGNSGSIVSVQHLKLSNGKSALARKAFWAEHLDKLKQL